jgi:NADH-quinone oxidoreductase subunit J
MVEALLFYLFAGITVASAAMVVLGRNAVHSVLFLIAAFLNSACLFLLLGAEFLALILVIVYVGAVLVLFLFVVMMLNVNAAKLKEGFQRYLPVGGLIGLVLLVELILVAGARLMTPGVWGQAVANPIPAALTNTEALGRLLYTDYVLLFQAAGIILLIAMVGAIVLTHRTRPGVKKQRIAEQVGKRAKDAIELVKVKPRSGITW